MTMNYQNNWLQNYLILLQNQNPIASANSSLQSGFPFPLVLMNNILTDPNQFAFNHNILTDQNQFAFNQNNLILNHLSANLQRNNQLQGGGDGFGAYSSHIAVNELSCSNIHPSNSLAMLSPPAESIKEAFRDLPIKSSLSYNDRIHESINYFFSTQKRLMLESESNLSSPKYDALNSHGVPYGSSLEKFQLFKDLDFNFAIPEKVRIFKQPHYLSSEEYKAIREDFASNGVIVSDIDECNPVLSPIGFFADSDFPLMELTSDDFRKFPATEVTSLPMQHSNTSIGSSSTDRLKKKRCKTDKKTSDDHCAFCENNGENEILYKSHTLKDAKGRVLCPRLRLLKCPLCGADGDDAHMIQHCPGEPRQLSWSQARHSKSNKRDRRRR